MAGNGEGRFHVADLDPTDETAVREAASLLVTGFREMAPEAWPNIRAALREVRGTLRPGRVCMAAFDAEGTVIGWIGGMPFEGYPDTVWELHPLVVREDWRRRGVGRALVAALEDRVRDRGGLTLFLGTDDEGGMTSLGGVDVYPDVLGNLQRLRSLRGHPFEFYRRVGFSVVGLMPDANGYGKPDIYMAKRVGRKPSGPPAA